MTETAEHPTTPTLTAGPPPPVSTQDDRGPDRVLQVLAWVGIVAGVVFVVSVVFFTCFSLATPAAPPGYGPFGSHPGRGIHVFHRGGPQPMGPMARWPGGPMSPMSPGSPSTPPSTTTAPAPAPHP